MTALRETRGRGGGVPARSRDYYLDAGREYVRLYGADELTASAFSPAAALRGGRSDKAERYLKGRPNPDGSFPAGTNADPAIAWPSLNSIKDTFGGFTKFREELKLLPNSTGPARGRRAAGEAKPILNVRTVRVPAPDSTVSDLRRALGKAERRVNQLARELDQEKAKVRVVEDHQKIEALRKRLADESARRREAVRDLGNAVRREERSRTRETALREAARGDANLLREVDRLTARLAEAETRVRELETGSPLPPKVKTKVVVRAVREPDEKLLRRAERAERRLEEARADLRRTEELRADLLERLSAIRRDAIAEANASLRVRTAEKRAEDAQREAREAALLLVGEARRLTDNEIMTLRREGPAGKPLLVRSLRKLIHALYEGGRDGQVSALTDVAGAAYNWRDRLIGKDVQ